MKENQDKRIECVECKEKFVLSHDNQIQSLIYEFHYLSCELWKLEVYAGDTYVPITEGEIKSSLERIKPLYKEVVELAEKKVGLREWKSGGGKNE